MFRQDSDPKHILKLVVEWIKRKVEIEKTDAINEHNNKSFYTILQLLKKSILMWMSWWFSP